MSDNKIYIYPEGKDEDTASARLVVDREAQTAEIELTDEPEAQADAAELMKLAEKVSKSYRDDD